MPSPFPGMDSYLEVHWGDIHQRVITYACDQLQPLLPEGLRARMEERVFVDLWPEEKPRSFVPDLRIVESRKSKGVPLKFAPASLAARPFVVTLDEPITETFIEIRDKEAKRLITVIEVLSLANKRPGPGRRLYKKKQREVLDGEASLVEIDLLRGGRRIWPFREEKLPPAQQTPYYA